MDQGQAENTRFDSAQILASCMPPLPNYEEMFDLETQFFIEAKTRISELELRLPFSGVASKLKDPELINTFFQTMGFVPTQAVDIAPRHFTTVFTGAGIQVLEPMLHQGAPIPNMKMFLAQPVVRLHSTENYTPGNQTAFLNLCTEVVNASPTEHMVYLGNWLSYFESLGVPRQALSFEKVGPVTQQWGNLNLHGSALILKINDIEVGDACFLWGIRHATGQFLTISDIGFGRERFLYAVTGKSQLASLAESVGNGYNEGNEINLVNSLSLLIGSGVTPGPRAHGFHVRQMIADLATESLLSNEYLNRAVSASWMEWSKWAHLTYGVGAVLSVLRREINRQHLELAGRYKNRE